MQMRQDGVWMSHLGGILRPVTVQSPANSQQPATGILHAAWCSFPMLPPSKLPQPAPPPLLPLWRPTFITKCRTSLTGWWNWSATLVKGATKSNFFQTFFLAIKASLQARSVNLPNFGRWKLAPTSTPVGSIALVVGGGALECLGSSFLRKTHSVQCNKVQGLRGGSFWGFWGGHSFSDPAPSPREGG